MLKSKAKSNPTVRLQERINRFCPCFSRESLKRQEPENVILPFAWGAFTRMGILSKAESGFDNVCYTTSALFLLPFARRQKLRRATWDLSDSLRSA